ncbi:MAG TPA: lipocalin family protein, partial [Flavisolibacter sp.]
MKKILALCLLNSFAILLFAQKQTYDLVSYTPPAEWKEETKNNLTSYTITDSKKNTWCQVFIVKSTTSKGSIEKDFESEWQELAVKNYNPAGEPTSSDVEEADGWKIKTGIGKFVFNNTESMVMVTTFSGYDRCVSIVSITNSEDYMDDIEAFLSSIDLKKQDVNMQQPAGNATVLGSWGKSNTVSQVNNRFGNYSYSKQQYTFNGDGSYEFTAKTYDENSPETYLVKESGRFEISGNTITLTPHSSVIET